MGRGVKDRAEPSAHRLTRVTVTRQLPHALSLVSDEQWQPDAEEEGATSDRAKGRHLTNPIYEEVSNGRDGYTVLQYILDRNPNPSL